MTKEIARIRPVKLTRIEEEAHGNNLENMSYTELDRRHKACTRNNRYGQAGWDELDFIHEKNRRHRMQKAEEELKLSELRGKRDAHDKQAAYDRRQTDIYQVSSGEKEGASNEELAEYFKGK